VYRYLLFIGALSLSASSVQAARRLSPELLHIFSVRFLELIAAAAAAAAAVSAKLM